jgi:hypothetical protein
MHAWFGTQIATHFGTFWEQIERRDSAINFIGHATVFEYSEMAHLE